MRYLTVTSGRWRWFSTTFIALSIAGCTQREPRPHEGTSSSALGEINAETSVSSTPLKVVDSAGLEALLSQQLGKVVLVDFWATWCAPCVQQLPHSFDLADERSSEGLVVITVCMEDPDEMERIQRFLRSKKSTAAVNLLSREGGSPRAMEDFEIAGGALPHYKLYDRELKLRRTFALDPSAVVQFTTEDIESAVEEILRE